MPFITSLLGRVSRNCRSIYILSGCQKAPIKFFPAGVSIAVLPPIDESTIDSSVVGTCTKRIPLIYVAATNPIMSPMTPPPRAMMTVSLVHPCDNSQSSTAPFVDRDLEFSPGAISYVRSLGGEDSFEASFWKLFSKVGMYNEPIFVSVIST